MNPADRFHILFLCTGNSARSILAEAIANRLGAGRALAWSAGSKPASRVNPAALTLLESLGYETDGLRSKSWDEFAQPDAPTFDLIVTVCDNAAGETCPVWPGKPMRAHWSIADPAAITGAPEMVEAAFAEAYRLLHARIERLLDFPLDQLDAAALHHESEGGTA
jgi:arsenate reductase (thioredoxin)